MLIALRDTCEAAPGIKYPPRLVREVCGRVAEASERVVLPGHVRRVSIEGREDQRALRSARHVRGRHLVDTSVWNRMKVAVVARYREELAGKSENSGIWRLLMDKRARGDCARA